MNTNRRLYRSDDPVLAGVCGGIAEYFELDPTLVRILTVILFLAGFGLPVVAYLIAMLIMPKRSDEYPDYIDVKPAPAQARPATAPNATSTAGMPGTPAPGAPTPGAPAPGVFYTAGTAGAAAGSVAGAAAAVAGATTAGTAGAAPTTPGAGAPGSWTASAPPPPKPSAADAPPPPHASAAGAPGAAGAPPRYNPSAAPPGCAHTACNPRAYDVGSPADQGTGQASAHQHVRTGIVLGILLVGIGIIALLGTFFDIAAWNFWPLIVVALGFVVLCTPGKGGWSLVRAGHAIALVTVGLVLQLWALDIVATRAFVLSFLYLWPVLLVMLGLSVIGSATGKSVFKLLGSLLFSAALLFGIWNFGGIAGQLHIDLPGDHDIQLVIPSPGIVPADDSSAMRDGIWLFER